MVRYVEPGLPYTLKAELRRVIEHAARCGYRLTGKLLLADGDRMYSLVVVNGRWRELEVEIDGDA